MVSPSHSIERSLAVTYAPRAARAGIAALFALDDALAGVLRSAREPMLAQMRLTWWHGQLEALDHAAPPAMPELRALAEHVVGHGVTGAELTRQVEGWEALIEQDAVDETAMLAHAEARGAALFGAVARLCGYDRAVVAEAGQGWALADLADHLSDVEAAQRARALAKPRLDRAVREHWGKRGRTLGALAHLARADLAPGQPVATGSPRRVARMAWHALTGR